MDLKKYYKNVINSILLERTKFAPKAKVDAFKASSSYEADRMRNREEDHLLTHSPLKRRLKFK
jgi:hypothetical protein